MTKPKLKPGDRGQAKFTVVHQNQFGNTVVKFDGETGGCVLTQKIMANARRLVKKKRKGVYAARLEDVHRIENERDELAQAVKDLLAFIEGKDEWIFPKATLRSLLEKHAKLIARLK